MLTKHKLEQKLNTHPLIIPRLQTLKLATEINPKFHNPHILGGFLRNIALDMEPNDCDVAFQGYQLNQPGITEAVRSAEQKLCIEPYPEWEFENIMATGLSGDFFENTVGKHSNHTDFLTGLMMGVDGKLFISDDKTLTDIENRIYDFRFHGIEIWANHRGKGRSYSSCIVGDLTRGLYLCASLNLTPSSIATFLFGYYDKFFGDLDLNDQEARKSYWFKKTKYDKKYQLILDRFHIKSLTTSTDPKTGM